MFANWKQSKSKNCWSTCFWSLDKSVLFCFLFWRPDTWKDKREIKCDQRLSNWGKEDILPYWFWCINEGGWGLLDFPDCILFTVLSLFVGLVFSILLRRWELDWAQPNSPWAACYKILSISKRQTAADRLHVSSFLGLALSLCFSLAHWSLLFKSHWYIPDISLSPPVCNPFGFFCFWRLFFAYWFYLPAGSCFWPWSSSWHHPMHCC